MKKYNKEGFPPVADGRERSEESAMSSVVSGSFCPTWLPIPAGAGVLVVGTFVVGSIRGLHPTTARIVITAISRGKPLVLRRPIWRLSSHNIAIRFVGSITVLITDSSRSSICTLRGSGQRPIIGK